VVVRAGGRRGGGALAEARARHGDDLGAAPAAAGEGFRRQEAGGVRCGAIVKHWLFVWCGTVDCGACGKESLPLRPPSRTVQTLDMRFAVTPTSIHLASTLLSRSCASSRLPAGAASCAARPAAVRRPAPAHPHSQNMHSHAQPPASPRPSPARPTSPPQGQAAHDQQQQGGGGPTAGGELASHHSASPASAAAATSHPPATQSRVVSPTRHHAGPRASALC